MYNRNEFALVVGFSFILATVYGSLYKNEDVPAKSGGVVIYEDAALWHKNTMIDWCRQKVACIKMAEAVYFEARGEGTKGMYAVAHVIKNSVVSSGKSVTEVVMKAHQFSYTQRKSLDITEGDVYSEALVVSAKVLSGLSKDTTKGSTHYVAPKRLKKMPAWTKKLTETIAINNHKFYRG